MVHGGPRPGLKDLGRGKSRDALGNANSLFKCAGCDLKSSSSQVYESHEK